MLYFPQLNSGGVAQFPIEKTLVTRTVVNETWSGNRVTYEDDNAPLVRWKLAYKGLESDEYDRIRVLFEASRGRLGTFTFLDPAANLLAWSEDLSQGAWVRDPLLAATAGIADPWGGTRATRLANSGSVWQGITQSLPVSGGFQYAFSVWARGTGGPAVRLVRQTTVQEVPLDAAWRRVALVGSPAVAADQVSFGLRVAPGGQADVVGFQVEAQLVPSLYKPSAARSGVYLNARFDQDDLRLTSGSFEDLSTTVEIVGR